MQMLGRVLPGLYVRAQCGRGPSLLRVNKPRPYRVYAGKGHARTVNVQELGSCEDNGHDEAEGHDSSEDFVKSAALRTPGNVFQATARCGGIDWLVLVL
jgi:hypothetical protein